MEKFLKNIKRAGQNRRAGGKIFSKSINVQTKIRPCRGEFLGGNFLPLELWDTLGCFGILWNTLEYFGIALGMIWNTFVRFRYPFQPWLVLNLLILRKNSPLHGLILVCTFIDFEKKFPPARLFHPACLLVLVCSKFHSTHDPEQSIPQHYQSNPKAIPNYSKVFQSIPKYPKTSQSSNGKKLPTQNSPLHVYSILHDYWNWYV